MTLYADQSTSVRTSYGTVTPFFGCPEVSVTEEAAYHRAQPTFQAEEAAIGLVMGKIENQAELVPKGSNKNWNQFRKVGAIEPSGTVRNRPEPSEPSEPSGTVRNRLEPWEPSES
uniref:Uncharacterized protein n=1 Tax=Anopheles culicifacies TaxID=139723 RepID=A0A182MRI6_9DIPT